MPATLTNERMQAQSEAIGKMILPAIAAMGYGGYLVATEGLVPGGFPQGTAMLFGGISCIVFGGFYGALKPDARPSLSNAVKGFGGLVPYVYAVYVMVGVGAFTLYRLTSGFSVATILAGLFWIAAGYRILYGFYELSELKEREKLDFDQKNRSTAS